MCSNTQKRRFCLVKGLIERRPLPSTMTISPGSTSRTKRAPMMSSAQLSDVRIQASSSWPMHQRPHAHRIAHAEQRLVGQQQQRVGALDPAQRVDHAVDDGRVVGAGDQVVDDLGVGGRLEQAADPHQLLAQQVGVGEVAVVGERQAAEVEIGEDRLDVAVRRAAGRGVAVMADRRIALQLGDDRLLAEDVADQAGGAVVVEMSAVEGDDAGGFLAAMLQRMQAERGVGGGIGSAVDAEQRTFLVKLVEVVVEAFGGTGHGGVITGDRRPRHQG